MTRRLRTGRTLSRNAWLTIIGLVSVIAACVADGFLSRGCAS